MIASYFTSYNNGDAKTYLLKEVFKPFIEQYNKSTGESYQRVT
jgi:hypothetical protein